MICIHSTDNIQTKQNGSETTVYGVELFKGGFNLCNVFLAGWVHVC